MRGAATFLIADGVLPGNEGRSYVLRRILRRAIRAGRKLGLEEPFLAEVAGVVIDQFAHHHRELTDRRVQIEKVLAHEEESFGRTLSAGMARFQALVEDLARDAAAQGETVARILPGREVFRLYDTYGFPFDLTVELAREQGLEVDQIGFEEAFAAQREISRGGAGDAFRDRARSRAEVYVDLAQGPTEFLGYEATAADARILGLVGADGPIEEAEAGDAVEVILDRTPFYGESGGQIGDTGWIRTDTGLINIDDTFKPTPDVYVHRGVVAEGFARSGEPARAEIDAERRAAIRRNHTATHLLHRALRSVLGEETRQAGSLVAPDRLRFDFTSLEGVTAEQLQQVAAIVNHEISRNVPVTTEIKPYQDGGRGGRHGALRREVRRCRAGGRDSRVLAGAVRRHACPRYRRDRTVPDRLRGERGRGRAAHRSRHRRCRRGTHADSATAPGGERPRAARRHGRRFPSSSMSLQERIRGLERETERLRGQLAAARAGDLLERAVDVNGRRVLAARADVDGKDALRQMGDRLRDRMGSGVVVLGAVIDGRPSLLAMVTPDLVAQGVKAGDIVRETAAIVDGRGGGRAELAEAGGKDAAKLDAALAAVAGIVERGASA